MTSEANRQWNSHKGWWSFIVILTTVAVLVGVLALCGLVFDLGRLSGGIISWLVAWNFFFLIYFELLGGMPLRKLYSLATKKSAWWAGWLLPLSGLVIVGAIAFSGATTTTLVVAASPFLIWIPMQILWCNYWATRLMCYSTNDSLTDDSTAVCPSCGGSDEWDGEMCNHCQNEVTPWHVASLVTGDVISTKRILWAKTRTEYVFRCEELDITVTQIPGWWRDSMVISRSNVAESTHRLGQRELSQAYFPSMYKPISDTLSDSSGSDTLSDSSAYELRCLYHGNLVIAEVVLIANKAMSIPVPGSCRVKLATKQLMPAPCKVMMLTRPGSNPARDELSAQSD